jgi:preprotein translocase subunit SecD
MPKIPPKKLFLLIVALTAFCVYVALPNTYNLKFNLAGKQVNQVLKKQIVDTSLFGKNIKFDPEIKLGLDLQGGTHLVLEADMSKVSSADRADALESAKEVIVRRIDLYGVSEPIIQTSIDQRSGEYRLIVDLPGIKDVNQALSLIGKTARLQFKVLDPNEPFDIASSSATLDFTKFHTTDLAGQDLKKATVQFDQQTGKPVVGLKFTSDGAKKFAEITKANIGRPVGIFLDEYPVTLPIVQTAITDGQAVINGSFTTETAKSLSIQLNAGALPVPIQIINQKNIGATLGIVSVQQSLRAGLIGLLMVMFFMIAYYGYLGALASLALIVYGVITLALYKILGITLTLPGLAGFMLSVGMAVDSNILIFERAKEEFRSGKRGPLVMELAFGRAWDSIKDANVTTLLVCFILFNPFNWHFLNSSGLVRGFALTLALGVLISLFTGIIVVRTLIRLFYRPKV